MALIPVKYSVGDILWVRETWSDEIWEQPLEHKYYYKADYCDTKNIWLGK